MKKYLFAMLVGCALILCACGNSNTEASQEEQAPSESISVVTAAESSPAATESKEGAQKSDSSEKTSEEYGLEFTEEEIEEAIQVATQYYVDLSQQEPDTTILSAEEASVVTERNQWLQQGVEIAYQEEEAYQYIAGSSAKDTIAEKGTGTVIVLQVTVPAAPEDSEWHQRSIELNREDAQSEWYFRTEGI